MKTCWKNYKFFFQEEVTEKNWKRNQMDLTKLPKNELISHVDEMLDSYTPKKQAKRNVALAMVVGMLLGLIA